MEFKEIQTIIKNFEKSTLTELEIVKGDFRIHLSKRVDKETTQTTEKEETKEIEEMTAVKSPLSAPSTSRMRKGMNLPPGRLCERRRYDLHHRSDEDHE